MKRESKLLFTITGLGLVVRLAFLFASKHFLVTYRLPDDALYYFTIAKHFAHGAGLSFDGVHSTNGYHPLWLFLITPVYLLHLSDWASIYVILIVQSFLDAVIVWRIGRFLSKLLESTQPNVRFVATLVATICYALNPIMIIRGINGLETTVTALALLLWFEAYFKLLSASNWKRSELYWLGIISGFTFLARTDMAVIMLVALAYLLIKRRTESLSNVTGILSAGVFGIIVILPWMWWNYKTFGSFVQVSGEAVPFVAQRKYDVVYGPTKKYLFLLVEAFRNMLKPFGYLAAGIPLISLIIALLKSKNVEPSIRNLRQQLLFSLPVILGSLMLLAFHSIVRGFIREWYVEGLLPVYAVVFGISVSIVLLKYPAINARRNIGIAVIFVALAAIWVTELRTPHFASQDDVAFRGAPFVASEPNGSHVAAFNTGYYGYFAPPGVQVSNLDGVVNPDAFEFLKQHNLSGYMRQDSIATLIDFRGDVDGYEHLMEPGFIKGFRQDTILTPESSNPLVVWKREGQL